jgi:methylenetetrahydrofolate dehydrogenase (NADP+)/methenyltetrahydrofolate cyclohydrolase
MPDNRDTSMGMAARNIDGNALAQDVRRLVSQRAALFRAQGRAVRLAALMVGSSPAGEVYAGRQADSCRSVGIDYQLIKLPETSTFDDVSAEIRRLNEDKTVTGIMLHLPLPRHLDETELQYQIDRVKDVEGVNPANIGHVVYRHTLIAPCTALAAIACIHATGVSIKGANATVVGASAIAGKPAALLLTEEMATTTLCHIHTRDLKEHTRQADILVVAVGKPGLITADHVRDGAVVIDVGINSITAENGKRKIVGDVLFDEVAAKASHITPVPGGVGPMTVAMLLRNTIQSAALVLGVDMGDDSVPATNAGCPDIPLRGFRRHELRDHLRGILTTGEAMGIIHLYSSVLDRFGLDVCQPQRLCPHYSSHHPEFWHVVRLALWDGYRSGEFFRTDAGLWKKA